MSGEAKDVERGGKEVERGGKEVERGGKEVERGAPSNGVAEDVFRRVSELGGLLVVAFVAPVASSGQKSRIGPSPMQAAISAVALEAKQRNTELVESLMMSQKKADKV